MLIGDMRTKHYQKNIAKKINGSLCICIGTVINYSPKLINNGLMAALDLLFSRNAYRRRNRLQITIARLAIDNTIRHCWRSM